MTVNFPTSLDSFDPPSPGQTLASPRPAYEYIRELQEAIEALEAAVGVVDSLVADSHEYRIDNHQHAAIDVDLEHDMLDTTAHTDSIGGAPTDGRVVMYVIDEDTLSEGWTARDLPESTLDHGFLAGLGDEADHPQYSLAGHSHLDEEIVDNSIVVTTTLSSAGTGNDRVIFVAPWACRVKTASGVMWGGTTPAITARPLKNAATQLFTTDIDLTDVNVPDTVSDPIAAAEELAAGDFVQFDVTAGTGTPNVHFQLEIERI